MLLILGVHELRYERTCCVVEVVVKVVVTLPNLRYLFCQEMQTDVALTNTLLFSPQ